MMKLRLLVVLLFSSYVAHLCAGNPLKDLTKRLIPAYKECFIFQQEDAPALNGDYFELSSKAGKIQIKGNNLISIASGLNWYLKYYCKVSISENASQLNLPAELPSLPKPVYKSSKLVQNFYMNYCTFSYSTAFWNWEDWEREIDRMALNGVNRPMAMVGAEVVWRNTLRKFNYSDSEINEFLCGPAFFAWLFMGNLEQHGGPLPEEWFERQIKLQKKIVARMREWGMKPVFQGFFGMVPTSLQQKFPDARLLEQGYWVGKAFLRPSVLLSTDPLFHKMADVWYREYEALFGKTDCFAGDLFHEGGRTGNLPIAKVAHGVQQAMLRYNPAAVWYIQAWGNNPKKELVDGLDRKHTVIIDLAAEFWSRWKERKAFGGFPWLWSHITNYGANVGLHGRLDAIAQGVIAATRDSIASPYMSGISATPEGIGLNAVVYDLANEMKWRQEVPDMHQWVREYSRRRYGVDNLQLKKAWEGFYETAYGTYPTHRRPSESVFCALPSLKGKQITASAWSQCRVFYDKKKYQEAVNLFLKPALSLSHIPTYQFDAVDFVRQFLADQGREAYDHFCKAYQAKDKQAFAYWSRRFLELLSDQDRLLSAHPAFFVGTWLEQARKAGKTASAKKLYEYNARLQIGTWSVQQTALRDYAHKEWGGMLRDYYYPRWEAYIDYLSAQLAGREATVPHSYPAEKAWVEDTRSYSLSHEEPVKTALLLFQKYIF